jgi:hypothetical protein
MKKLALSLAVAALVLAIPGAAYAQKSGWDGLVHQGDFAAFLGLGLGRGFTVAPGVEYAFVEWKAGHKVPLSFGAAGKGEINFWPGTWTSFGIAAVATAHLGLKGLDIPDFLQHLDIYIGPGIGLRFFSYDAGTTVDYGDVRPGFAWTNGVAYYFNDKWAGYLEFSWWSRSGGAILGARYTF